MLSLCLGFYLTISKIFIFISKAPLEELRVLLKLMTEYYPKDPWKSARDTLVSLRSKKKASGHICSVISEQRSMFVNGVTREKFSSAKGRGVERTRSNVTAVHSAIFRDRNPRMHAGMNVVIYNAFETERGKARGDNIAQRNIEKETEGEGRGPSP